MTLRASHTQVLMQGHAFFHQGAVFSLIEQQIMSLSILALAQHGQGKKCGYGKVQHVPKCR